MRRSVCWRACGLLFMAAWFGGGTAEAQEPFPAVVLPDTEQRVLRSADGGIPYKLYVSLPSAYRSSGRSYPVVYLLDADYSFAIARNVARHLSDRGDLEETILVGIAYDGPDAYRMNRTRDYTPTHVPTGGYGPDYQVVSGGGPAFLDFIANELVPFVEAQYRVSSERFLVGHSYGGLFATWVALTRPDLFSGFVIVSPSLWYDDGLVFRVEQQVAPSRTDWPVRMHMTVGAREINQEHNMVADLRRFAATVEGRAYPGLRLRWGVADDQTHNSIFPRAVTDGLRFVLEGRE